MLPRIPLLPRPPQQQESSSNNNKNNNNAKNLQQKSIITTTGRRAIGTSSSTASGGLGGGSNSFSLPPLMKSSSSNEQYNNNNNNNHSDLVLPPTASKATAKLLRDLETATLLLEKHNHHHAEEPSSSTKKQSSSIIPKPPSQHNQSPRSVLSSLVNPHPASKSILANRHNHRKKTIVVPSSSRKPLTSTTTSQQQQQQAPITTRRTSSSSSTTATQPRLTTTTTISSSPSNAKPTNTTTTVRARGVGIDANQAIFHFEDKLAPFEIDELQRCDGESGEPLFPRVYFAGLDQRRKLFSLSSYDDENCDYKTIPGDHIQYRYEIVSYLGKGSFGQVVKALDHKTGDTVALKVIKNKKKFHEQAAIERHILEYLNQYGGDTTDEESVFIRLRDCFNFRGHCVFVFDLHGLNLYDRLKANNFASTPMYLIQQYARQLLKALEFTHKHGIVHCDLKPENILVAKNNNVASIRLIDFGSSCFMNARIHTYIQSRFYRAPEVCLGLPYTPTIDTWSLGCVLYELFFGNPLFAVQSEADLIGQITSRLGPLPQHLYERAPRKKHFYEMSSSSSSTTESSSSSSSSPRLKKIRSSYAKLQRLDSMFVTSSSSGAAVEMAQLGDLIMKMVRWDPASRISPAEALQHPFLQRTDIVPPRSLMNQLGNNNHEVGPKSSRTKRTASQQHYSISSRSGNVMNDIYAPLTSRKPKYAY